MPAHWGAVCWSFTRKISTLEFPISSLCEESKQSLVGMDLIGWGINYACLTRCEIFISVFGAECISLVGLSFLFPQTVDSDLSRGTGDGDLISLGPGRWNFSLFPHVAILVSDFLATSSGPRLCSVLITRSWCQGNPSRCHNSSY